jgi:hypothetical protein
MQVYRLEDTVNELPTHWSYCDADEDRGTPGFQVWGELSSVIAAACGHEKDGYYTSEEGYNYFHVIEASGVGDGAGEWFSVECEDVESLRVIEVSKLTSWVSMRFQEDINGEYPGYEEDLEGWLEDSESEILGWLKNNLTSVNPVFVNTLPKLTYA